MPVTICYTGVYNVPTTAVMSAFLLCMFPCWFQNPEFFILSSFKFLLMLHLQLTKNWHKRLTTAAVLPHQPI